MAVQLCVGNLAESVQASDLTGLFAPYGHVRHAEICMHAATGRAKGFGWVIMAHAEDAADALKGLNGSSYAGRTITVVRKHLGPRPGEFGDRSGDWTCGVRARPLHREVDRSAVCSGQPPPVLP